MILYITKLGLYAVRHQVELRGRHIRAVEVVEVVPETGEDKWKLKSGYYPSETHKAVEMADRLEEESD